RVQHRILRIWEGNRRVFFGYAITADSDGIGADVFEERRVPAEESTFLDVVLDHQRAAVLDVLKETLDVGAEIGASVEGSDAGDDGVMTRKIGSWQTFEESYRCAHLPDCFGDFVFWSGDVADILCQSLDIGTDKFCGGRRKESLGGNMRICDNFGT